MSTAQAITLSPAQSRWLSHLILTIAINFVSAFIFPNYVTDAFSWPALLSCLAPNVWAGCLLFRYRTHGERVVACGAILLALCWLLPAIGLVAEFGFR